MADNQKLTAALEKEGYTVSYYETADAAAAALCEKIQGKTVGRGGSKTLEALGLYEKLGENNQVFWHWKQPADEARANAAAAQIYLTSANGVAETGEIINIDGTGNRLAASIYDKEKVYFIIGVNKIATETVAAGASIVVLAHNHPGGVALPSKEDIVATGNAMRALGLLGVHVQDHIIVAGEEYTSLRDTHRLPFYNFKTGELS